MGAWVTLNTGGGGLRGRWKYPRCPTLAPERGAHPPNEGGALPRGHVKEGKGPARQAGRCRLCLRPPLPSPPSHAGTAATAHGQ